MGVEGRRRTVIHIPHGPEGRVQRVWRTGNPSSPALRARMDGIETVRGVREASWKDRLELEKPIAYLSECNLEDH